MTPSVGFTATTPDADTPASDNDHRSPSRTPSTAHQLRWPKPHNPCSGFGVKARELKRDQQGLDELESGIASVLLRLSALELARPNGLRPVFTPGEVDRLMRAAHRINRLGENVMVNSRATDVTIEIARNRDGSVVVFPALPA